MNTSRSLLKFIVLALLASPYYVALSTANAQTSNNELDSRLAGRIKEVPRERYSLFPDLRFNRSGMTSRWYAPVTNPPIELFRGDSLISSLNLKDSDKELLKSKVASVNNSFNTMRRSRAIDSKRKEYSDQSIKAYIDAADAFEGLVNQKLDKERFEYLRYLSERQLLLRKGIKKYLEENNAISSQLSRSEFEKLLNSIDEISKQQITSGNSLILDFAKQHLASVEMFDEEPNTDLPAFPLKLLHTLIVNADGVDKAIKKVLSEYEIKDVSSGEFSFLMWSCSVSPVCDLEISRVSYPVACSMLPFVTVSDVKFDMSYEQSMLIFNLVTGDKYNEIKIESRKTKEVRKAKFEQEKLKNEAIKKNFVPFQLDLIKRRVRLHAFVVFGARYCLKNWRSPEKEALTDEEVDSAIKSLEEKIHSHCLKTEQILEKEIRSALQKAGIDEHAYPFRDRRWQFESPEMPTQYEFLLFGCSNTKWPGKN